ncbi:esterase [Acinetobacter sp. LoGeW2-3]|uniref:serine hydrolase domain-containing protein n=1 Tax=Acinetobacter sp. LoGeW2-3 TaxID=1808001 RepID=UPI000C058DFE|nr:serine hydrolase domain-containing protein [Acinetobacter sp. LoGeW2-3]ATO20276.1 esterase [Acinetobacter sp. LoGeW2-3]
MKPIKEFLTVSTDNYQGYVYPRFHDLAVQFSCFQDARAGQGGAALVVYHQGEKVLDIYTGKKSEQEPWQPDTMSVCYSTGKGVLATLAHILVSRGLISYDTPVAEYWPEFAQQSKGQITLAHMLSHQSGLYDIRNIIDDAREMLDWSHMLERIAATKPRFELGTAAAYQPLTFGWQVGGALEKATGKTLAKLMNEYLVKPLQLDGAYFGVPEHEFSRVARPIHRKKTEIQPRAEKTQPRARKPNLMERVLQWSGQNPQDFQDAMIPKGMKKLNFFSDEGLKAIIPAATGVFTANSLARVYAMLAQQGQWQEQELISQDIFKRLSTVKYTHRDRIMPLPMHWRLGYHRILTLGKSTKGFGHVGFNGSGAWCDPDRNLSFAYTHNFPVASITGDYRLWGLTQEALRCADQIQTGRKGWF